MHSEMLCNSFTQTFSYCAINKKYHNYVDKGKYMQDKFRIFYLFQTENFVQRHVRKVIVLKIKFQLKTKFKIASIEKIF